MSFGDADTILTEFSNDIKSRVSTKANQGLTAQQIANAKANIDIDKVPNVATNDQTPTFLEESTRTNIASGDKLSLIFGKIKKFFSDLKTVAFTGNYNDLTNKPPEFVDDPSGYLTHDSITVESGGVSYTQQYYHAEVGNTAKTLCAGNDSRLSNARPASDVYAWAKAATKPTYTASEVGACANNDSRLTNSRPASDVYAWAKASSKPSYSWSEITSKPKTLFDLVASFENTSVKEGYANITRYVTLANYDVLFVVGGAADGQLRVYNAVPVSVALNRTIQNNVYIDKRYYFNIYCTSTSIQLKYIYDPNYYLTRYIWVYGLKN